MKGLNANAREKTLKTPLHLASKQGHVNICEILLKNGADILCKDFSGAMGFHYSCTSESEKLT